MKARNKTRFTNSTKHFTKGKTGFTVLVPLQDVNLGKILLPAAIQGAKRNDGKIILLNIIEIPYQLPPSGAEQFISERKSMLQNALQIIETAGCAGEIMVRIAHRLPYAIEQLADSLGIDLIIMRAQNKGFIWNQEIYQNLNDVSSNLLIAKEQVETDYEEVIIQVDDLQTASSMMEQAAYLLGSEDGTIRTIPVYNTKDKKSSFRKLKSMVDEFRRQNPWFSGKTIINQLQSKSATKKYLNKIYHHGEASISVLISYPSRRYSTTANWLEDEINELNIPVFISKVGRIEPLGIYQIADQVQEWLGIASK